MELRCPDCCSPDLDSDRSAGADELRCGNCGACIERDYAFVSIRDAEAEFLPATPQDPFAFHRGRTEYKLRWSEELRTVNPYSDADEIHRFFEDALRSGAISCTERASILIYPESLGEGYPMLAIGVPTRPTLLGKPLSLDQREDEDPIAYTLRILTEGVEEANRLVGERGADSARLDRIASFMNEHRPWRGEDVCRLVVTELVASGRYLLAADE